MSQPDAKKQKLTQLDALKSMTVVVADSGDIKSIKEFLPQDATTNPSLIFQAAQMPAYEYIVASSIESGKKSGKSGGALLEEVMDRLAVSFGCEILKIVPGRVSTEVDARLSFDKDGSIKKARKLIAMYAAEGVDKSRVLIKLASTWEGIEAARQLQKEGINCNMTLLFNFEQAVACADAGAFLISPFVGRILDWYKKSSGKESYPAAEDPGVLSVAKIYNYYKTHGIQTIVMAASFRNIGEIQELAGCDYLTIAPKFLKDLSDTHADLPRKLDGSRCVAGAIPRVSVDEKVFRFALNEDAMATEKLAEGIRNFVADIRKLEDLISKRL